MKTCEKCGQEFGCGKDSVGSCWCKSMAPLKPIPEVFTDCLCPTCLAEYEQQAQRPLTEGEDYYHDEWGNFVFTAKFHLRRGYCCGNGCRHCPYGKSPVLAKN